ncbi:MAG: LysR substrate-binding domain-containing protein [Planctomycetota bacterium]
MSTSHTPLEGPARAPRLPSTASLAAFEAALRHGSFTGAARELGVTQGAVSRQVALLEEHVGRELFLRGAGGVRPSRAGQRLARELPGLLDRLTRLVETAGRAEADAGPLRIALLPTFGTTWLIPRLPEFLREHPEVTLDVSTSIGPADFRKGDLDAAIHYGEGVAARGRAEPLFDEVEVAVCAPELRARFEPRAPRDLARLPLLHLTSRPQAWRTWFEHHGEADLEARAGQRFEHHLMVLEAARAGLGVALLPSFVADGALRGGELAEPIDGTRRTTRRRYWLLAADASLERPSLRAFRRWLRSALEREGWAGA